MDDTGNEKQTVSSRLTLFPISKTHSASTTSSTSDTIKSNCSTSEEKGDGGWTIKIAFNGKSFEVSGISHIETVNALKQKIAKVIGVSPDRQRLACKGVMLNGLNRLCDTKLVNGGKVSFFFLNYKK